MKVTSFFYINSCLNGGGGEGGWEGMYFFPFFLKSNSIKEQ